MSSVKDSPDPGDQPNPARQAMAANAYLTQAESIVKVLQKMIAKRLVYIDPSIYICGHVVQMTMAVPTITVSSPKATSGSPMTRAVTTPIERNIQKLMVSSSRLNITTRSATCAYQNRR
ncbi:hypothetical protein FVER53590_09671 [Fusarium verticillioides]|nr:hypothetical protein FVER53590_09671 [Fusarium verticillioides]